MGMFGRPARRAIPQTPAQPRTSQMLGFYQGATQQLDDFAIGLEGAARQARLPVDRINSLWGMSAEEAAARHRAYVAEQMRRGLKPGLAGLFVSDLFLPGMVGRETPR